ncbi:MAG: flippase-like domain-containing protein [Gemmatimonadetes bacterium]|nr:flippase-like domain-containing protein [Gemmatimonadota bacterium]
MKRWLRVFVSVGLLALIVWFIPWDVAREALSRVRLSQWVVVLTGFVAGHLVSVFKWRHFVRAGGGDLSVRDAAQCYSAGLFANLCLPSLAGGDVLRLVMAGRVIGRPAAALLGGVLDRLTDMIAMALLSGAGALLVGVRSTGPFMQAVTFTLLAGIVGAAGGLVVIGRVPLAKWPRKLRRPIAKLLVGLRQLRTRPAVAVEGLVLSLSIQGFFVWLNMYLGTALGVEQPFGVWLLVWPLAKVVSLLPISLGGLAVREASLAALLAPFGVPLALGVTVSLLWQSVLIGGGLLGGLAWFVLSKLRPIPAPPLFASRTR